MNISSPYTTNLSPYTTNAELYERYGKITPTDNFSSTSAEKESSSFASFLDKATLSAEGKEKAQLFKETEQPKTEHWKAGWQGYFDYQVWNPPTQNYDRWLPENLEQLNAIQAQVDKLINSNSNKESSPDNMLKQLAEMSSRASVLNIYGEKQVVTPAIIEEALAGFEAAKATFSEREQLRLKEGEGVIVKQYLNTIYGNPEEIEERLKQWKARESAAREEIQAPVTDQAQPQAGAQAAAVDKSAAQNQAQSGKDGNDGKDGKDGKDAADPTTTPKKNKNSLYKSAVYFW